MNILMETLGWFPKMITDFVWLFTVKKKKTDTERYFKCWNQYTVKVTEELTAMGHTQAISFENLHCSYW